jgi:TatD DNase family protein
MILTDTHIHWYLKDFDPDRNAAIKKAIDQGISRFFLPCIDSFSVQQIISLCKDYPENCFGMIGLHPCSVDNNYEEELKEMEQLIPKQKFYAIGEIGIDLYWDKTFFEQQKIVFKRQILQAQKLNLPIVIHMRNSFDEVMDVLLQTKNDTLKGIFHCFSGTLEQAILIIEKTGFKLGIGGVLTFKNSNLFKVIEAIDLKHVVLETDAPYLAPHPNRGKRNEGSYLSLIAQKIAEIKNISLEEVAEITTDNSKQIFGI